MKGIVVSGEEGGGKGGFLISWMVDSVSNACSGCRSRLCWLLDGKEEAKA